MSINPNLKNQTSIFDSSDFPDHYFQFVVFALQCGGVFCVGLGLCDGWLSEQWKGKQMSELIALQKRG